MCVSVCVSVRECVCVMVGEGEASICFFVCVLVGGELVHHN